MTPEKLLAQNGALKLQKPDKTAPSTTSSSTSSSTSTSTSASTSTSNAPSSSSSPLPTSTLGTTARAQVELSSSVQQHFGPSARAEQVHPVAIASIQEESLTEVIGETTASPPWVSVSLGAVLRRCPVLYCAYLHFYRFH